MRPVRAALAVSTDSVADADALHGTTSLNGFTQRPPLSSTIDAATGCPSTSTLAMNTPPPWSAAENDTERTPESGLRRVEQVAGRRPDQRRVDAVAEVHLQPTER